MEDGRKGRGTERRSAGVRAGEGMEKRPYRRFCPPESSCSSPRQPSPCSSSTAPETRARTHRQAETDMHSQTRARGRVAGWEGGRKAGRQGGRETERVCVCVSVCLCRREWVRVRDRDLALRCLWHRGRCLIALPNRNVLWLCPTATTPSEQPREWALLVSSVRGGRQLPPPSMRAPCTPSLSPFPPSL